VPNTTGPKRTPKCSEVMNAERVTRLLMVVLTGVLVAGASARAATTTIRTPIVPRSPLLAGDLTLWMLAKRGPVLELWSARADSVPARVQRFALDPTGSRGALSGDLAGSPSLTLLTTGAYDTGPEGLEPAFSEHWRGEPGTALEQFVRCEEHHGGIRSIDVSGQAYVYRQCDEGGGHVEVRDEATPPLSPPRSVGEFGYGARIAGRYVAWLGGHYRVFVDEDPPIVVYDRVSNKEVYRISAAYDSVENLDVQEDGKVAVAFNPDGRDKGNAVAWASPAEPWLHRLPLAERDFYDVRMERDRIALQRSTGPSGDWVPDSEIGLATLTGEVRWLARRTYGLKLAESFDYDGERVLWRQLACDGWRLVVRDLDDPGIARGGAKLCGLGLRRAPAVRNRTTVFRFRCAPLEPPCRYDVSLRLASDGRRVGTVLDRRDPVRVRLTRPARRLLARRGAIRVRVTVDAFGAPGYEQLRRGVVRLAPR
jgi:hypothetical protein